MGGGINETKNLLFLDANGINVKNVPESKVR